MKILFYSIKEFERSYLQEANNTGFEITLTGKALSALTVTEANGFDVISIFTGDDASAPVLDELHKAGVKYIAVRAAGYDNIDLDKASELGIRVANVPEYSPFAIAEHALTLMLVLNRHIVQADKQVHAKDFTVDKLVGFDLHGKTIGIIGTGKIGSTLVKILHGFGCRLLGYDINENKDLQRIYGLEYVSLEDLCSESDIISMHTCFTAGTKYIIDRRNMGLMKKGVMLINTSRGACINTDDLLNYLESGHVGYFGADVYEREKGMFFYDCSGRKINDPILEKLLAMPNVLITPHQAFATHEALSNIAQTTFHNIRCWTSNIHCENELKSKYIVTTGYGEDEEA